MKLDAPRPGVRFKALIAVGLEDGGVRHPDERRLGQQLARLCEDVEAGACAHSARKRALRRAPDHRPFGERIRKRKAELDDVGASLDGGARELRRLGLGDQVDDELLAHRRRGCPTTESMAGPRGT